MIIGCIITICTFIAAVLISWNHMVKITKGPKNEKETGYYQWNHNQMDSFSDITTFTYQGERYETADGGGDGARSFGYLEASMKGRKLKKNSQNVKETLTFFFNSTIVVLDRNTR